MQPHEPQDGDIKRLVGNLVVVGFTGTVLSRALRKLIIEYHVGAILLTSKNLQSVVQATTLISSIQSCAKHAGYTQPLLIGLDQENGSINSFVDPLITQFPSCMGISASTNADFAIKVAQASAAELRCTGVNWILGPVLDVLSDKGPSPLGVRAFGDDPIKVMKKSSDYIKGYQQAGQATCGKHFPSYGNVVFADGNESSVPSMHDDLGLAGDRTFIPFQAAVQEGIDAILVGGCSLQMAGRKIAHACLDSSVIGILRNDWSFDGVVLSECLAMEMLCNDVGISQGASLAINAGCDMVLICQSSVAQTEVLDGLFLAVQNGTIPMQRIVESNNRVNSMKEKYTSWQSALNPAGEVGLHAMRQAHEKLSKDAYASSISIVRDYQRNLECLTSLEEDADVLLLTPLLDLFPSTATRGLFDQSRLNSGDVSPGEIVFQDFGRALAEELGLNLTHMSYSSNGIRPIHEKHIAVSKAVIVVTADASRNTYQYGVTKHVNIRCKYQGWSQGVSTMFIVVAVSSPYDFLADDDIETYVCTYDFTPTSLATLASILSGNFQATGVPPLAIARQKMDLKPKLVEQSQHQRWLVEMFDLDRDWEALERFFQRNTSLSCHADDLKASLRSRSDMLKGAFIIRNTSTKTLFGILAVSTDSGSSQEDSRIVLVDQDRQNVGIEDSLRNHAIRYLSK